MITSNTWALKANYPTHTFVCYRNLLNNILKILVKILTIVGRHSVGVGGQLVVLERRRRRRRLRLMAAAALVHIAQEDVREGAPQVLLLLLLPLVIGYHAAHAVAVPGVLEQNLD